MKRWSKIMLATAALSLAGTSTTLANQGQAQKEKVISVTINRLAATDNLDGDFIKKDQADFYVKVTIGGFGEKSPVWHGKDDARPNWMSREVVDGVMIPIRIDVWDEDGAFEEGDDTVDVNPKEGVKHLQLYYNTSSGRITGDVQGWRGRMIHTRGGGRDSDKAQIWFTINHS